MVGGSVNVDPGLVMAKSVDTETVWGTPAAKEHVLVSGSRNFDPGIALAKTCECLNCV